MLSIWIGEAMSQTNERLSLWFLVIVGGLGVVVLLGALTELYFRNVQLTSVVLGAFVGACGGAGIGAFGGQFTKGYYRRATLGPLPWFSYVERVAWLRAIYVGERQNQGCRRALSEPIMASVVEQAHQLANHGADGARPIWWCVPRSTGMREGPVTLAVLKLRLAAGRIAPEDLVWREGMAQWVPASTIAELAKPAPPRPRDGQ